MPRGTTESSPVPATGLRVNIYRWSLGECSAGGLSSRCQEVTLIGPGVDGPFEPTPEAPAVKLVRRRGLNYVHVEPDLTHPSNAAELARLGSPNPWFMAGGTLINSCDSRFRQAVGHDYALSFHDRCER